MPETAIERYRADENARGLPLGLGHHVAAGTDLTDAVAVFPDLSQQSAVSQRGLFVLHRLCLYGAPLLIAFITALLPPDANFDLANYHYYNPWALLTGHSVRDLAPAGIPSFFNPLLDVPFYWANTHLPGRVIAFLLGLTQAVCFPLLYLLGRKLVFPKTEFRSIAAAAGVAIAGITASVSIAELGTTFYDYVGAAGLLLCLLLLARHHFEHRTDVKLIAAAGLALGMVVGFKLTNVHYAVGLAVAVPFLEMGSPQRRGRLAAAFFLGGMAGFVATGGFWMAHLWSHFGNPIYPFFNNLFHSSAALPADGRDIRFLPHGPIEALLYPFIFTAHPERTIEFPICDFRFLALCLAIPVGAALLAITRRQTVTRTLDPKQRRYLAFLLLALAVSYFAWLGLFSIRRYGLAFEMLAPLVVAFIALELPHGRTVAVALIGALIITTKPVMMGRGEWHGFSSRIVDAQLPMTASPNSLVLLTGWQAKAYLAPSFPVDASFVTVGRRKIRNVDYSREISRRITTHKGPILALTHKTQMASLQRLGSYGLKAGVCRPVQSTLDVVGGTVMMCEVKREIPDRVTPPQTRGTR